MGKRAEDALTCGGWLFAHSPPIVGPLTTALGVALWRSVPTLISA
jgi:hypothetical protein